MSFVLKLPPLRGSGTRSLERRDLHGRRGRVGSFYDPKRFAARIHRPKDQSSVAIIWDPDQEDLQKIGGMRRLLAGVRTLPVLPDGNPDTIALAYKILPSFISYVNDGIAEIVSVLERLTGTGGKGPPTGARR